MRGGGREGERGHSCHFNSWPKAEGQLALCGRCTKGGARTLSSEGINCSVRVGSSRHKDLLKVPRFLSTHMGRGF